MSRSFAGREPHRESPLVVMPLMLPTEGSERLSDGGGRLARTAWKSGIAAAPLALVGCLCYSAVVADWGFRTKEGGDGNAAVPTAAPADPVTEARVLHDEVLPLRDEERRRQVAEMAPLIPEPERLTNDCVVIGYNVDPGDGTVSELLLGSVVDGNLRFVGVVSKGIETEVRQELSARLRRIHRPMAFIPCPRSATWVKPIVTCRATFRQWDEDNLMQEAVFGGLLPDVEGIR